MRISPFLVAVVLCAASVGAASGQEAVAPISGKAPSGLSFAFDAPHGQFTASGIQLVPSKAKSNAATPTTGTVDVTVNVSLVSKFRKGTSFPCAVIAIGGILDLNNGTVDGGIETAFGIARVNSASATSATCTVSIPYAWNLASDSAAGRGLILAFAVAAVDEHGNTLRSTLQLSGIENLPASGTTSKFAFDAAL